MKFSPRKISELEKLLEQSNNFLILGHQRPDGDCAGSVLAWYNYLKQQGKNPQAYLSERNGNLDFLANYYEATFNYKEINLDKLDCIITCDFNDLHRGALKYFSNDQIFKKELTLINIDHHVGKSLWADLVFSHEEASSTTMIIYEIFKKLKVNINSDIATCLLTGLLTDTNFLKNKATKDETFVVYEELLNLGADEKQIIYSLEKLSPNIIQALGELLGKIHFNSHWQVAIVKVKKELLDKYHLREQDIEILYELLLKVSEYKVVLLLKQTHENVKILKGSWRTREDIDVGKLSAFMGGGGHKKAAGFSVQNYE